MLTLTDTKELMMETPPQPPSVWLHEIPITHYTTIEQEDQHHHSMWASLGFEKIRM